MSKCTSPNSLNSDYGSASATSSDDDTSIVTPRLVGYTPGVCPHCKNVFDEPQTLQCGHSLCAGCVAALLELQSSGISRRSRIRMGISSCNYGRLERTPSTRSISSVTGVNRYRSPQCIVCGEKAKATPPVPNLELKHFIESMRTVPKLTEYENPAYRQNESCSKNGFESDDDRSFSIRDCRIAVVGGPGVGKTSLRRVQYGNDIIFTDILGRRRDSDISDTFMLDIIDGNNSNQDIDSADGFVLVYSIIDRDSFNAVRDIHSAIVERRGATVPLVLVGTRADNWRRRRVESFEGQHLARSFRCPFLEVSSKRNDNVNEVFVELMRVVETQRLQ